VDEAQHGVELKDGDLDAFEASLDAL